MTAVTIHPRKHYYKQFIDSYIMPAEKGGYRTQVEMLFILDDLQVKDYDDKDGRFTIKTIGRYTEIRVMNNTWFDGVTMGIDYDTRMMFALLHDMACHATREARDHSYRDALNDLAYEIVTAQNGFWFNGLATERAVKKYSKLMKIKGEF